MKSSVILNTDSRRFKSHNPQTDYVVVLDRRNKFGVDSSRLVECAVHRTLIDWWSTSNLNGCLSIVLESISYPEMLWTQSMVLAVGTVGSNVIYPLTGRVQDSLIGIEEYYMGEKHVHQTTRTLRLVFLGIMINILKLTLFTQINWKILSHML